MRFINSGGNIFAHLSSPFLLGGQLQAGIDLLTVDTFREACKDVPVSAERPRVLEIFRSEPSVLGMSPSMIVCFLCSACPRPAHAGTDWRQVDAAAGQGSISGAPWIMRTILRGLSCSN